MPLTSSTGSTARNWLETNRTGCCTDLSTNLRRSGGKGGNVSFKNFKTLVVSYHFDVRNSIVWIERNFIIRGSLIVVQGNRLNARIVRRQDKLFRFFGFCCGRCGDHSWFRFRFDNRFWLHECLLLLYYFFHNWFRFRNRLTSSRWNLNWFWLWFRFRFFRLLRNNHVRWNDIRLGRHDGGSWNRFLGQQNWLLARCFRWRLGLLVEVADGAADAQFATRVDWPFPFRLFGLCCCFVGSVLKTTVV